MARFVVLLAAALTLIHARAASAQHPVVYHVPVVGRVDLKISRIVEAALQAAERAGGVAVILDIRSSGGRVDAAQLLIVAIATRGVPVYALVNAEAAGAAALAALAADSIFMVPASSLGAGSMLHDLPAPAARAVRDAFRALVERRGLDPRIGEAMVDEQIAIRGAVAAGELLTLEAEEAVRFGVAQAQVAGLDDLLNRLGLEQAEILTATTGWTGTTVEVTNRNWRDMRIYILRGGMRFRLGTVTSMNSEEFEIPGESLVPGAVIQVLAEVIGSSERITTEEIRVEPGLVIQWGLENVLSHSSYFYFVRD